MNLEFSLKALLPRILAIIWWLSSAFWILFFILFLLRLLTTNCIHRSKSKVSWGSKQEASVHFNILKCSASWRLVSRVCASVLKLTDKSWANGPGTDASWFNTLSIASWFKGENRLCFNLSSGKRDSGHLALPFRSWYPFNISSFQRFGEPWLWLERFGKGDKSLCTGSMLSREET